MAKLMSDFFRPAFFAIFLAFFIKELNSSILGGETFLRITISFSPNTTNCVPVSSLSFFRIFSGMMTCPLEDNFVDAMFAIVIMNPFLFFYNLTCKIITEDNFSRNLSFLK